MSGNSLWYKDAVFYQLHVRSFYDAGNAGVGNFRGITEKLPYLQDLGVTVLWLLPFYPSPLKDEGYDIAYYAGVHSMYGDTQEFKIFLREAHRLGLRVVTELVLNHTSDQHPWFQRARRAPAGSNFRDFYVWSDNPEKYKQARIIFKDFEHSNWTWDTVAKQYYWHRFYSHQPDLNFDHPEVRKEMIKIVDFWFDLGVDGMRLDAVPYLFEREGTNCENLKETHQFLKDLRTHVDTKYDDRMLLAEANQWPEDAVAYFGKGDECHMAFHFPIMPRMFMAIHMEDRYPVVDILDQTPAIPETAQWALFLRNHDELTLEMVTDEERDYMYRVYANDPQSRLNLGIRRRLASLLGNNRRKIELMNGLLLSLPGTPVIYYGDELGMGDNIYLGDRNGVRTPMQWSGDRNAGFSKANPQKLFLPVVIDPEYHYETVNVEAQQSNPHSLLWWMKRLIALRKQHLAFGRGSVQFLTPENRKVLAFIREYENERILVIANLSRFVQYVELDLSRFKDLRPVELFGRMPFPRIGDLPYFITLGPHAFYWFCLEPDQTPSNEHSPKEELPQTSLKGDWSDLFSENRIRKAEALLPAYLKRARWFGGKNRKIKSVNIVDTLYTPNARRPNGLILVIDVLYLEEMPERYLLTFSFYSGEQEQRVRWHAAHSILTQLHIEGEEGAVDGIIADAMFQPDFCFNLLEMVLKKNRVKGEGGRLEGYALKSVRRLISTDLYSKDPVPMSAEQSNSSVVFGDKMIFKLYRKIEAGRNPDLEMNLFLTEKAGFERTPAVCGYGEYVDTRGNVFTSCILQQLIPNEGDAWKFTLDELMRYYERVLAHHASEDPPQIEAKDIVDLSEIELGDDKLHLFGEFLESVRLLGRRTAELHLALSSDYITSEFAPEMFSFFDQRSIYQSIRNQANKVLGLLKKEIAVLPEDLRGQAEQVTEFRDQILTKFQTILHESIQGKKIRCHGDYHLGQILFTGKDFFILDFEGEPARSMQERKLKRSPLKDVAGMVRSFHYAAFAALWDERAKGQLRPEDVLKMESWAEYWYWHISACFLRAYRGQMGKEQDLLPSNRSHLKLLLEIYLLEKAFYEIEYELRHRPKWIRIPIQGIKELLRLPPGA